MRIPIQVISLARSRERRDSFSRRNAHVRYEFFDAVDGQLLDEAQLRNPAHFVQPLLFASHGAYGCALSHLKLWERAIDRDEILTIAEDDAVFRHDFAEESTDVLSRLPSDWDLVLWGWNFDSILSVAALPGVSPVVMMFDQDQLRRNIGGFQQLIAKSHPLPLDKCFGMPAYTVSPKGARRFKELCFPMKDFEVWFPMLNKKISNLGMDVSMNRVYADTRSYVAFPPLVASRNERSKSTVQPS